MNCVRQVLEYGCPLQKQEKVTAECKRIEDENEDDDEDEDLRKLRKL
ncbi:MAG TPA: hypothetical protein VNZ64_16210 [Candidatus Acidoferrum sp.]|nr:hypothetical protein [Candidatus Acidoferrum sp.]